MTTPNTARTEADADPAATLAALRKTWARRERDLVKWLTGYEEQDHRVLVEITRTELREVRALLDFIGR